MITESMLAEFNQFLAAHTGLYFSKANWPMLEKGLVEAAKEFGCETPGKCIKWLMSTKLTEKQVEILASYLTVGETYFFREKKSFDILGNIILPELIEARKNGPKKIKIWSAACSTGEEAYSIAIVLDRKKEALKVFDIFILGTDINTKALQKARDGIYGEWSFRDKLDDLRWLKEIYFTREEKNKYKIRPFIRNKVTFTYLNLVSNVCPPILQEAMAMDIIFCRNVLMYFEPHTAQKVVAYLVRCMAPGGWLVASPTDAFNISEPGLIPMNIHGAPVYRKIPLIPGKNPLIKEEDGLLLLHPPQRPQASHSQQAPQAPQAPIETVLPGNSSKENDQEIIQFHYEYEEALKLYRQGYYKKAAEILESMHTNLFMRKVVRTNDDEIETEKRIFELLARSNANQGKLDKAEEWCKKAVAAAKLNLRCRYLLALIQRDQGKVEDAAATLKQCLYIDPNFIPAHFTLGHIAWQKKNYSEANHYFDICLSLLNNIVPGTVIIEIDGGMTADRLKEIIINLKMVPYE